MIKNKEKDKSVLGSSKLPKQCDYEKERYSSLAYDLEKNPKNDKDIVAKDTKWIEELNEIAALLTPEKSRELVEKRKEIINEKMRKIEKREDESDVAIMELDEDYDEEEWDMILGNSHNDCIKEDLSEGKSNDKTTNKRLTQVLNRGNKIKL